MIDPPRQVIFTWGAAGRGRSGPRGLPLDELPRHRSGWDHYLACLGPAVGQVVAENPEDRFAALVEFLAGFPDVSAPGQSPRRRFGSSALKVSGSIFAVLSSGRLVVKLPRNRVETLIASGTGGPFDAGKGSPMKEWLTVIADNEQDGNTWTALAREALAFVGSKRR